MRASLIALLAMGMILGSCNRNPSSDDTAEALANAAQQSNPEAAAILNNAAKAAEDMTVNENLSDPNSLAQNALEQAGNTY